MGFFDWLASPKKIASRGFDPTDRFYNDGYKLEFFHVPTGRTVGFKAFLTAFQDQFNSSWSSTPVYGRMDDIKTFQGTTRTISVGWDVVAYSEEEADLNLRKCSLLASMLYPVYSEEAGEAGASTIKASPLLKVKFANLISEPNGTGGAATSGLVATMASFNYAPDLEQGIFVENSNKLRPQLVKLSCELTVLHTHKLGWDQEGKMREEGLENGGYPYSVNFPEDQLPMAPPTVKRPSELTTAEKQEAMYQAELERLGVPLGERGTLFWGKS
jgi:hypothetical protein